MTPHLDYALIRARAADTGVADATFRQVIGLGLDELQDVLDEREVSLTLLVRLAALLDLSLDELVVRDDTARAEATTAVSPDDTQLLLALLLTYGRLDIEQLLDLLGWSRPRLTAAATNVHPLLDAGPLRLVTTDLYLLCVVWPGVISATVRARFTDSDRLRRPLTTREAHDALRLVHDHLLQPFGDNRDEEATDLLTTLADRGIATDVTTSIEQPQRAVARPHPDLLFALRLVDTPHAHASGSLPPPGAS